MDDALRQLNDRLDLATQRLLDGSRVLPEPDLRAPSLLPEWSRADVLAHLARGADAMRALLAGARAGQQRRVSTGTEEREAAAAQAPKELTADLAAAAMALRTVIRQLPDQAWSFRLEIPAAEPFPASELVIRRLVEVELRHCDLGIGYDAARWPAGFAGMPLPEPMHSQRQDRMSYPPQSYRPAPARAAAAPAPAQQRAMILRSLSGGPRMS